MKDEKIIFMLNNAASNIRSMGGLLRKASESELAVLEWIVADLTACVDGLKERE